MLFNWDEKKDFNDTISSIYIRTNFRFENFNFQILIHRISFSIIKSMHLYYFLISIFSLFTNPSINFSPTIYEQRVQVVLPLLTRWDRIHRRGVIDRRETFHLSIPPLRIAIVEQGEITDKPNEGQDKIERIVSMRCETMLDFGSISVLLAFQVEDRTTPGNKAWTAAGYYRLRSFKQN